MKKGTKLLIGFAFFFIVALFTTPLIVVQVPYTGYVTYTEQEPHTDTEYYTEKEPATRLVDLKYQDATPMGRYISRPCSWDEEWSCIFPSVRNVDTVGGMFKVNCTFKSLYDEDNFIWAEYVAPGQSVEFNCRGKVTGQDVIANYHFIPPKKEVTEYKDVPKTREVVRYNTVEKTKEEIRYCNAWKKIVGKC